jgi:hypothetical protein
MRSISDSVPFPLSDAPNSSSIDWTKSWNGLHSKLLTAAAVWRTLLTSWHREVHLLSGELGAGQQSGGAWEQELVV